MTSLLAKGNVDVNTKGVLHFQETKDFLRNANLLIKTRFFEFVK